MAKKRKKRADDGEEPAAAAAAAAAVVSPYFQKKPASGQAAEADPEQGGLPISEKILELISRFTYTGGPLLKKQKEGLAPISRSDGRPRLSPYFQQKKSNGEGNDGGVGGAGGGTLGERKPGDEKPQSRAKARPSARAKAGNAVKVSPYFQKAEGASQQPQPQRDGRARGKKAVKIKVSPYFQKAEGEAPQPQPQPQRKARARKVRVSKKKKVDEEGEGAEVKQVAPISRSDGGARLSPYFQQKKSNSSEGNGGVVGGAGGGTLGERKSGDEKPQSRAKARPSASARAKAGNAVKVSPYFQKVEGASQQPQPQRDGRARARARGKKAVKIKVSPYFQKAEGEAPQPQPQLQPQPKVPVNPDDSHAFLKSRLEMACAAVARFNEGTMKPGEPIGYPKMPLQASISTQSDFQADGSGHGVPIPQGADSGSLGISALPTIQRDSGVHVKQTTSESSREDSDDEEFEGDTGTTENKDPAEVRRARRMQSNRESARRSRRRKQEHMSELENQVGQLKVEHTGLLKRLTDMNQKYDVASVDNRILKADIETLRAKVKMAEETVKRVTGINPLVIAMSNLPSSDIPFGSSPMDSFTTAATPMQPNADHFFHHAAPNITSINPHHPRFDSSGFPRNNPLPVLTNVQADAISNNVAPVSSMQGVPGAPGAIPGWSSNIPPPLANTNIKHK